ncbi:unnamed protein product [Vitrella brassicaformis CCMP3155]|uniref:Uncharacterized protein n=2 Tax=Vitrella brassicaformis TaxID=1169539 RepID=A0A0G4ESF9_VITBC|nr:unnamed protein product [Vitrella brassicaformis CCMP3155]|eukprot:CEM00805.1 unnamed protein product [Vitrella brassicaformis CCMP3155]
MGFSPRFLIQASLTGAALATGLAALVQAILFLVSVKQEMNENFEGELTKSKNMPCVRKTLDICSIDVETKCGPACCPLPDYTCDIDPAIGLNCRHDAGCGDDQWCLDWADIHGECKTDVCQQDRLVESLVLWTVITCGIGSLGDMVDILFFLRYKDANIIKTSINVLTGSFKFMSLSITVAAGASHFMEDLSEAKCYAGGSEGEKMVDSAVASLLGYTVLIICSAVLSFVTSPFSAYFGGKTRGVPYVRQIR